VFNNKSGGLVTISSGTLVLAGAGSVHHGDFDIGTDGTLHFSRSNTIEAGAVITAETNSVMRFSGATNTITSIAPAVSGLGTLRVESGSATFHGNLSAGTLEVISGTANFNGSTNLDSFNFTNGTVNGADTKTITVSGLTRWTDGTIAGAGAEYHANGGMALITSAGKNLNAITMNISGDTFTSGNHTLALANGATINQSGTWTIQGSDSISASGTGTKTFNNSGDFIKEGGAASGYAVEFNNSGSVDVKTGRTLNLTGGGIHTGDFIIGSGARLTFSGTHALQAASTLTSHETATFAITGGTTTIAPALTLAGHFSVTGASAVTFNDDASLSTVTFNGTGSGTINGNGIITASGLTEWIDGEIAGVGGIYNANGGLNLTTGAGRELRARTLNVSGDSFAPNNHILQLLDGATINHSGTWTISSNASISVGGSGTKTFNNSGTFTKASGSTSSITPVFNNTGTVNANANTLTLASVAQHDTAASPITLTGGTWNVSEATLNFSAVGNIVRNQGNVTLSGPTATFARFTTALNENQGSLALKNDRDLSVGNFSNSGTLRVEDATTRLTVTGAYTQSDGSTTLIEGGELSATDGFNLQGGSLTGDGTILGNLVSTGSPVISPGASAGSLAIAGNASLSGTLIMEIGGLTPGIEHDQLLVGGNLTLGGTLALSFIDGFVPQFGQNITLVQAGSAISDSFANVPNGERLTLADGIHSFAVHYGPESEFGEDKVVLTDFSDSTPPVLTLPANMTVEATDRAGTPVEFVVSADDAVQKIILPPALAIVPASGSRFPVPAIDQPQLALGVTTVNVSASDVGGNEAIGSFTVTVVDNTPPIITPPLPIVAEATGPEGAAVSFGATVTDIVDPDPAVVFTVPGDEEDPLVITSPWGFPLGTTVVTVTATDISNNPSTTSFTITVEDTTPPAITAPTEVVVAEATGPGGAIVDFDDLISASDLVDPAPSLVADPSSGSLFPLDDTTVTVTASDATGNKDSVTFTVRVRDTTAPVITAPAEVVVEATGSDGAFVEFGALISAIDLVDPDPVVGFSHASGSKFPLGPTTVTITATDFNDNEIVATFTVIVEDNTAPALNLPDIVVEATSFSATDLAHRATATDIVDGDLSASIIFDPPGLSFPFGETTVNASVTDAAGNQADGSFSVTVRDTTPPDLTVPAAPVAAFTTSVSGIEVDFAAQLSASDLPGAPDPTVVAIPPSGSLFPLGTTTVTVTATDHVGLETVGTFDVIVTGQPVIAVEITGGDSLSDGGSLPPFATTMIGATSVPLSLTIRNTGAAPLDLGLITVDGDHPDDFAATSAGGSIVEIGGSTSIAVEFSPTDIGSRTAILRIANNDPHPGKESFDLSLAGTGIEPPPLEFVGEPVIAPATATAPAVFSAAVTGPPGAVVKLEASNDLGQSDAWRVIGQIILNGAGEGAFTAIADPGSIGKPNNFYRLWTD